MCFSLFAYLNDLRGVICGKSDEHYKTDDFPFTTTSGAYITPRISAWMILDINRGQSHRIPGRKSRCDEATNEAREIDVSVLLTDVNGRLQHQNAERYPSDPADEAQQAERGEKQEHDAAAPVLPTQHVNGSRKAPHDVQDASDPDELLCEEARQPDVYVGEDNSHCEHECEADDGVPIETEVVAASIDTAIEVDRIIVAADGDY